MKVLFLDDDPRRHRGIAFPGVAVTHVYNYMQAIRELSSFVFDIAYLDHDLFYETIEHTGYDVAKYIVEMAPEQRPKRIVIHSHNETDRHRMFLLLRSAGCEVSIEPFPQ